MRILLVEDNADHRELMRLALTGHNLTWQVEGVVSGEEALRCLAEGESYDVVFLDYSLPGRDGLEVLEEIRRGEVPPPVVMVTGRGDEQVAVEAIKGGAYDYVVKAEGYLQRLPVVAQRAVEAHQLAVERKQMEESLQFMKFSVDHASDPIVWIDYDARFFYVNDAYCRSVGYSREELLSMTIHDIDPNYSAEIWPEFWKELKQSGSLTFESCHRTKEGKIFPVEVTVDHLEYSGKEYHCGFARDITERKRAEDALRRSEEEARQLARENKVMAEIGRIISSTLNIDEVYERFAEEVRKFISFDRIAMNVVDIKEGNFTIAYAVGTEMQDHHQGDIIPLAGTLTGEIVLTRSSRFVQEKTKPS